MISVIVVVLGTVSTLVTTKVILPEVKYNSAMEELNKGNYDSAIAKFSELGDYKNSEDMIIECKYQYAVADFENGSYTEAVSRFTELGEYKNSKDMIIESKNCIKEEKYEKAVADYNNGNYKEAVSEFEELDDYKDSSNYVKNYLKKLDNYCRQAQYQQVIITH